MRLTTLILIINLFHICGASYSQEIKLDLKLENVTLKEVFSAIEQRTNYKFLYRDDQIEKSLVTVNSSGKPLNEVLPDILKKAKSTYKLLNDNLIVIIPIETMQMQKVIGTITDKTTDEPLPGVNITVEGTTLGTVSDAQGNYTIQVPNSNSVLVFSFVGYNSEKITVFDQAQINIGLIPDITKLEEIVVVGYGTQKKSSVTGALSTIKSDDLVRGTSNTIADALTAKVAGITWREAVGSPGSAPRIQIRNGGEPLFVIDGVMTDASSFNNLDQNDVEDISILKDGSSAIYGVKAANGVVLVTTKRGHLNQKMKIDLNVRHGVEQWSSFPKMCSPYDFEYSSYMREVNTGEFSGSVEVAKAELEKWKKGYYNPETGEDYRGFDYFDEFVKPASNSYYNISATGGSDKINYNLSASLVDQDAVFKDYNFKRYNIRGSVDAQVTKKLKLGFQIRGRNEINTAPGIDEGSYASLIGALYNAPPIYRPYANDNPKYITDLPFGRVNPAAYTIGNSGSTINDLKAIENVWTLQYDLPLKGLKFTSLFSLDYRQRNIDQFLKGWQEYSYDKNTQQYNVTDNKSVAGATRLANKDWNINNKLGQFLLNYSTSIASHDFSAVGGFEYTDNKYNFLELVQAPVSNELLPILSTNANNTAFEDIYNTSTASLVYRLAYSYKNKYNVNFSGRYDGSWKFPEGKKWGFFPSISASWQFTEEEFFKGLNFSSLTYGKIRASYGKMGDDNLGINYFAETGYNYFREGAYMSNEPWNGSASTRNIGSVIKGIPNTNLTWMAVSMSNIGMDLWFFDKLNIQFDAFQRKRTGVPAVPNDVLFPRETGLSVLTQNLNSDGVLGIDGSIKWINSTGSFKWNAGVNWTLARQKNFDRYGEIFANAWEQYRWSQSDRWANVEGGNIFAASWMWQSIGVFKTQEQIDNYPVDMDGQGNATIVPGDLIKKDFNNDGVINDYDKRVLGFAGGDWPFVLIGGNEDNQGNKQPLLTLGINLGFEFKGIDFAADLGGGYLNTYTPDWSMKVGMAYRGENGMYSNNVDVWHHEDIFDTSSPWVEGTWPTPRGWANPSATWWVDYYVRKVNYLRLKNITIGYTLPNNLTDKLFIQKVRFYFQGKNLFFVHNSLKGYYGIDPESSTVDGTDYPQHKGVSFGINMTF